MNNYDNRPTEPLFAEEMLERANIQANKLIEKAIAIADELMERANTQAHSLVEKANLDAYELIERANQNENKIYQRANLRAKSLVKNANPKELDLIKTANTNAKILIKGADDQAKTISSETVPDEQAKELVEDAEIKAHKLVKDAAIQAKDLVEEAEEEAKDIIGEADLEAKDLVKLAAVKAKELIKDAAKQSRDLIAEASLQTKSLVREAASQAKDLIREASARYVDQKLRFINNAAHELRTPVTSISLNVQFAQRQVAKGVPINENFLSQISGPLDRLTRLLAYLVDMSLLERKLLVLSPVKTNLTKIIMECMEDFRQENPKCQFVFLNLASEVELLIDPIRINQVISNLIDNAVKYGGGGKIEVSVNALPNRVRVEIKDYGPGLSQEQQKLIFGTFQRIDSAATIQTSGLGLGLSLCSEIIKLHHGRIGVQSQEGIGSTFFFELPTNLPAMKEYRP